MNDSALILVDLQNDYFPGGKWPLQGIEAAAANARQLLERARGSGDLVIHVRHETPGAEAKFFLPGSEGAQIHANLLPEEGEIVILKNHANSFRDTELKATLERHGVSAVTVCGAMSHMCIDATVRAACDFGYAVSVVTDACATRDLRFGSVEVPAAMAHAAFMAALSGAYATAVATEELLEPNSQAPAPTAAGDQAEAQQGAGGQV